MLVRGAAMCTRITNHSPFVSKMSRVTDTINIPPTANVLKRDITLLEIPKRG